MRQIGREPSFTPFWFHGLQQAMIKLAPAWIIDRQVMRIHQGFRARHYKRLAKQQAEEVAVAAAAAAAGGGVLVQSGSYQRERIEREKGR